MFLVSESSATKVFETTLNLLGAQPEQESRLGKVKRVSPAVLVNNNPTDIKITTPLRKWKLSYAEAEWEWYQLKTRSIEYIADKARTWKQIADEKGEVNSNYGWQLERNGQLDRCVELLQRDPDTRRAICTIGDGKEVYGAEYNSKDIPCTLSFQFIKNDDSLDLIVTMRSCDLVWGYCNDQYMFSKWLQMIAEKCKLPIGRLVMSIGDLHIYERHWYMLRDTLTTN